MIVATIAINLILRTLNTVVKFTNALVQNVYHQELKGRYTHRFASIIFYSALHYYYNNCNHFQAQL